MPDIVTDQTKKHSLTDHLEARDAALHNSNMANLASAVSRIDEMKAFLLEEGQRLTDLATEIGEVAADPDKVTDTDTVKRLYERATIRQFVPKKY